MGKSGMKESSSAYGKGWVRYPESKRWGDRYFKTMISLHVYTWEMYHGEPVPDGYVVHHIDGDVTNNNIENLLAMPKEEHAALHMANKYDIEKLRELAAIGREYAKAWHSTKDGLAFHSEIGKKMWSQATKITMTCENCGKEYETWAVTETRSRFCSNKCKAAWRRKSGVDDEKRICEYCGKEYYATKYKRTFYCSRACSVHHRFDRDKLRVDKWE